MSCFRSVRITAYLLLLLGAAAMGVLSAGCLNYRVQGLTEPRLQEGFITFAITNSSARSSVSSSPEAVVDATYCRVIIQKIEIADTSKVWIPVLTGNRLEVDLLDPNVALDKLWLFPEGMNVRSQTYYYVRFHLSYLETDAFDPTMFHPSSSLIKEVATSGFQVNSARTTTMIIDLDGPGAFKNVADPLAPGFSVESISWLNREIILIPYSRTIQGRQGVWTSGEEYGYYHESTMLDTVGNVVGSFTFNNSFSSGTYTFSAGKLQGVQGTFQFIRDGFTTPNTVWKGDISSSLKWAPFSPAFIPRYFVKTIEFDNTAALKIIMVWANSADWGFWTADTVFNDFSGYFYHLDEEGNSMPFGSHAYTRFDTDDYSYRWFEYPGTLRQEWWAGNWEIGPTIDEERAESHRLYSLTE